MQVTKTGEKKRMLSSYRGARLEAEDLSRRLDDMREKLRLMNDEADGHDGAARAIEKGIQNVSNLERRYNRAYGRCMTLLEAVEAAIEGVPDATARVILRRRYIDDEKVGRIASELNYAAPTVYEVMRKAIAGMEIDVEGKITNG